MNKQPIETAHDTDLRLSRQAMQRAAQRARELAVQTGTVLVVSRHGVIEQIDPRMDAEAKTVQEPMVSYGVKP